MDKMQCGFGFDGNADVLSVELPMCNAHPLARDAQVYAHITLWADNAEEIQGVKRELRFKWSNASLRDKQSITAEELVELMSVRGESVSITP